MFLVSLKHKMIFVSFSNHAGNQNHKVLHKLVHAPWVLLIFKRQTLQTKQFWRFTFTFITCYPKRVFNYITLQYVYSTTTTPQKHMCIQKCRNMKWRMIWKDKKIGRKGMEASRSEVIMIATTLCTHTSAQRCMNTHPPTHTCTLDQALNHLGTVFTCIQSVDWITNTAHKRGRAVNVKHVKNWIFKITFVKLKVSS